eukprot:TRINITY_DN25706_c0_g1_i4.p1 TRINITY_DN25706_c0_g1~~TRINITY_DN25706_c0_g1_i4.p1  ORF type:complete len:245 (+),score=51.10 TRINITY_DN25706_c0_g1_i4:48-737(+)
MDVSQLHSHAVTLGLYYVNMVKLMFFFFFFKQKTAYEMQRGLVGSEMCIRDRRRVHGGGESFHSAKFGHDFGFIPEKDIPFLNRDMKCKHNKFIDNIVYGTQIYEYVGGYFGYTKNIESLMMREIRARGPLQASILCPISFGMYSGGIINCENDFMPKERLYESEEDIIRRIRANFSPVEHLITVMGWGAVSYTHLTLPTILLVQISVVAVSLKKKKKSYTQYGTNRLI